MKEHEDKYMDEFVEKVMKQSVLETPSVDFTALVMGKVEAIKMNSITTYKPLISKRTWVVITCLSIIGFFGLMWFGQADVVGEPTALNFSFLDSIKFSKVFDGIHFSTTTRVSILMFCVMLLIQIPLLKNYFDKRVLG